MGKDYKQKENAKYKQGLITNPCRSLINHWNRHNREWGEFRKLKKELMEKQLIKGLSKELQEAFEKDYNSLVEHWTKIKEKVEPEEHQTTFILPKVTRVEVIQHSPPYNGRAYTNMNCKDVELQYQDNGRTLKVFIK